MERPDAPPAPALAPIAAVDKEAATERVRAYLRSRGVTPGEIEQAISDNVVDLLVADRTLVPSKRSYSRREVSKITGMPVELAERFWRALGFPGVADDERVFTDLDIEAITILEAMVDLGLVDIESAVQLARVMGSSMARIAEAEVTQATAGLPGVDEPVDSVIAADTFSQVADRSMPAMARLLEFVWRRHVQAATRRAMWVRTREVERGARGASPELVVGFADMVGFTMLAQRLSEQELGVLVSRFEELSHDIVTSLGGRVVKMIGDEAMFVSESPLSAARIALQLVEAYADDELLSDVRVALSVGPVLIQDGDYFGTVVNLASLIMNIARPGSVLVSDQFHDALLGEIGEPVNRELAFTQMRPSYLKDLGRHQLWVLHRQGEEPAGPDRRLSRRVERLAEVLRDLDELRDRGERLIAGGFRQALIDSGIVESERAGGTHDRPDGSKGG